MTNKYIEIADIILTFLALISPYIIMYIIKRRRKCYKCGNNTFTWGEYIYKGNDLHNNWKCKSCNQSISSVEIKDYNIIFRVQDVKSMRYNCRQRIKKRIRVWYCRRKGITDKGQPLPMFEQIV